MYATVDHGSHLSTLNHLVIVPGHAIWKGTTAKHVFEEDSWHLEPFQRGGGSVQAIYNHIARGVDITLEDERALLVFSGGQTKKVSTTTEGESYLRLAHASSLLPSPTNEHFPRATTEDNALDSFQNLLFSIARFHEYTGHYPSQITIVGFEIKRRRFTELHRAALRWPEEHFHYVGIDVEGEDLAPARNGERQNGWLPYVQDSYGCHDFLLAKRRARNPFNRFHPYFTSSPELAALFNWCPGQDEGGQTALYPGPLPWDK
ncbi:hypothetical protein PHLGIDRAFT_76671 [Phlebiopsis gigantea 11061_1 CR5-6]|uniref:DUF218 domain-containing protein n=1 Tax=Phlebiopsis gigantea (strain 11061_1 CR5-6) TaxID=745531 RepID=A0A0C3S2T1_PHLG1|nr:hypothetical protein PHLGIDRAFT_76671 [Phlebiopsis gigantea 11061_1 CR5-6]